LLVLVYQLFPLIFWFWMVRFFMNFSKSFWNLF
jgi:hypothetical protein